MARKTAYVPVVATMALDEVEAFVEEVSTAYKARIAELAAQLEDVERENVRLRDELDTQETDAIAVAQVLDDLDHALAFGHMDRVADVLAGNPYNMLTRDMLHVSLTLH